MRPFRFRALAALDLRRQQEQDAAIAMARVEAHFREAEAACDAIERHRVLAQEAQMAHASKGIDEATLFWHRNWIIRLQATANDLRAEVHRRAEALDAARRAWQIARQRHLTLERMRQRAHSRHRDGEALEERREIDELARLRFTMPQMGRED
jgi:flagellar export protein FliJ